MPPGDPDPLTFEQALGELDLILRALEDGTTTLDASLAQYERGVGLLRQCYGQLRTAEQRITQLVGVDDAGAPLLQSFDHSPAAEAAAPARRKSYGAANGTRPRLADGEIPF